MTSNYISIKSVLYDLSLTIDEKYWNEIKMLEWANKAARLVRTPNMLDNKVTYVEVIDHKAVLPEDFKFLVQIAYLDNTTTPPESVIAAQFLPDTSSLLDPSSIVTAFPWKAMRLTSNPYHASICLDKSIIMCTDCMHEFSLSTDNIVTTTLKEGVLMISYLGYPLDENGEQLIPDNEELKEAILNYVLYRYWMAKYNMMEDGADSRMKEYKLAWQTSKLKATGNMNLPDVNEMENLKNQFNRLVPRENQFQKLFLTLGNRENVNF